MAMSMGGTGGWASRPNITPMIDVLLVLLVIFMIITPMTPKGENALIPQPPPPHEKQQVPNRTVVVQVLPGPQGQPEVKINQQDVSWNNLTQRLTAIFAPRAEKVMFVKADKNLPWSDVAQVIDDEHAAGVDKVGLITAKVEAGS